MRLSAASLVCLTLLLFVPGGRAAALETSATESSGAATTNSVIMTTPAGSFVPIEQVTTAHGGKKVPVVGEVEYVIPPLRMGGASAGGAGKYVLVIRDGTGTLRITVAPEVWAKIPFEDKIQPDVHLKATAEISEIITSDETGKFLKGNLLSPEDLELVLDRPKAPGDEEESGANHWPWVALATVSLAALGGMALFYARRRSMAGELSHEELAERERAEEALKQGMARVELLLSSGPSVIYSLPAPTDEPQEEYRLTFVSASVEKLLGYTFTECLASGAWWSENVHPEDRGVAVAASREAMRLQKTSEREYRFRHKNGDYVWISDQQRLLRNPDGTVFEILGTWSDVSERAKSDRMKMLFASLGQRLSAISTKEEAARVALRVADELFGWDASYVSLYSAQDDRLQAVVSYDLVQGRRRDVAVFANGSPTTPLTRGVLESGARLIRRDTTENEKELAGLQNYGDNSRPSASLLFVPIRKGGKGIGLFSIQSYSPNAYKDEDLVLLQLLADFCGAALERTMAEERRKEAEERYALALRGANDGLWDWDLRTNRIYFSPRWKAMIGFEDEEIGDTPNEWISRIHATDMERVKANMATHVNGNTEQLETQYRMLHKDGDYRWMLMRGVAVRDPKGEAYRMAGSLTDVTMRRKAEEQLMHGAYYDALTGLPNRLLFTEQLKRAVSRCKRHPEYLFSVLFIDLDRFKIINDSLGHLVGDQLLINVAGRLRQCIRPEDMVARLGGDEFTILLEDILDPNQATRVAERIQEELVKPVKLGGHDVYSTASIGIAFSSTGYDKAEDILRDADVAMYRAKQKGKARHELFDSAMHDRALEVLRMEADLRRAVERQEFRVYYQPLVSLSTGQITGFEALVRWEHPERGMVQPLEFIPLAEENGLIVMIGWWVMREACRQTREWQQLSGREESLSINVNFSRKQFSQPDLVSRITAVLEETGLNPKCLALEITESVLMENAESLETLLGNLKAIGLQLHMDDFGTGYSSLSYLHRFPIDTLKIDRSFVSRMQPDGSNVEIVRAIVNLARSLSIGVVAEGVETVGQLDVLRALSCDMVQGYLLNRPVEASAIPELLSRKSMLPAVRAASLK